LLKKRERKEEAMAARKQKRSVWLVRGWNEWSVDLERDVSKAAAGGAKKKKRKRKRPCNQEGRGSNLPIRRANIFLSPSQRHRSPSTKRKGKK